MRKARNIRHFIERRRRMRQLRRELRMTRGCEHELDMLLRMIGIDAASLEVCTIPLDEHNGKENQ